MTQRSKNHVRHSFFCTCGMVVRGNGGKAQHSYMHEKRADGHHYVTQSHWDAKYAPKPSHNAASTKL